MKRRDAGGRPGRRLRRLAITSGALLLVLGIVVPLLALALFPRGEAPARETAAGAATAEEQAVAFADHQLRVSRVPAAAVAVVKDGEAVASSTIGKGITTDTPFLIGSLSKSFTATAVMQLVDDGLVELDAPVTRYIPWFRTGGGVHDRKQGADITVRMLLNQTSGLPTAAGLADLYDNGLTLEERVRAVSEAEPTSKAGHEYQYCNKNYATLGLLIEHVSRTSYANFVQTHIFDPLHMTHSFTDLERAENAGMPHGSNVWFGANLAARTAPFPGALPDGYLVSSANDLAHFVDALVDGTAQGTRILSQRAVRAMHTPGKAIPADEAPGAEAGAGYGFGLIVREANDEPVVSHAGEQARYASELGILIDQQTGLVMLTARNGELFDPFEAFEGGLSVLAGEPTPKTSNGFGVAYLSVDVTAVLVLLVLGWSIVRQLRRGRIVADRLDARGWRRAVISPALRRLLAAAAFYELVFLGLGYSAGMDGAMPLVMAFNSAPDVTMMVLAIVACLTVLGLLLLGQGAATVARGPVEVAPARLEEKSASDP